MVAKNIVLGFLRTHFMHVGVNETILVLLYNIKLPCCKCIVHEQALGDTETYNDLLITLISPTHGEMEHSQNLRESCVTFCFIHYVCLSVTS